MNIRISNVAKFGLYLSCFPYFGLNETDHTALERQELSSASNILQLFIFALTYLTIFAILLNSDSIKSIKNRVREKIPVIGILTILCFGTILSTLINTPTSQIAWFRTFQFIGTIFLTIISIRTLLKYINKKEMAIFFLRSVANIFTLTMIALVISIAISPSLSLMNTENRGVRLGGSFIHPNTLALGAVLFLTAIYHLFLIKKISNIRFSTSGLAGMLILILTGSSGGIFIFGILVFFILSKNINPTLRNFGYLLLAAFLLYATTFTTIEDDQLGASLIDRLIIWEEAWRGIYTNPIIGVGPYVGVKDYFFDAALFSYFAPPHAHNLVLTSFLSRGIIFTLPFLILLGYFFTRIVKSTSRISHPLEAAIVLLIVIIGIHGFVESSFFDQVKAFCHGTLVAAMYVYATCIHKTNWNLDVEYPRRS